ncbi:MAG: hypothetical protein Q7W54_13865, partial [Bacteroidota bacterium]|nr:hypothetical protein [Bacteroidota bacterium]
LKLMENYGNRKCDWQQMLLRAFILKGLLETDQAAEAKSFRASMQKDYGSMDWVDQFVGANLIEGK